MFAWTVDKFINPAHATAILERFYFIGGASEMVVLAIASAEMLLILAFVAGMWKKITYGLILLFHGLTTLASWNSYIPPDVSLTFFAAWPMFAASIALYMLRDLDVKYSLGK